MIRLYVAMDYVVDYGENDGYIRACSKDSDEYKMIHISEIAEKMLKGEIGK